MTLRLVGALLLGALWALVTVANGLLVREKLRGRESGSFVPFLGALLGVGAILLLPWGSRAERLPFLVIPVALDVGVVLWALFLVGAVMEKLGRRKGDEGS